jgi:hypothetical protein
MHCLRCAIADVPLAVRVSAQGSKPMPDMMDVPVAASAAGVALSMILGPTELLKVGHPLQGVKAMCTQSMIGLRQTPVASCE